MEERREIVIEARFDLKSNTAKRETESTSKAMERLEQTVRQVEARIKQASAAMGRDMTVGSEQTVRAYDRVAQSASRAAREIEVATLKSQGFLGMSTYAGGGARTPAGYSAGMPSYMLGGAAGASAPGRARVLGYGPGADNGINPFGPEALRNRYQRYTAPRPGSGQFQGFPDFIAGTSSTAFRGLEGRMTPNIFPSAGVRSLTQAMSLYRGPAIRTQADLGTQMQLRSYDLGGAIDPALLLGATQAASPAAIRYANAMANRQYLLSGGRPGIMGRLSSFAANPLGRTFSRGVGSLNALSYRGLGIAGIGHGLYTGFTAPEDDLSGRLGSATSFLAGSAVFGGLGTAGLGILGAAPFLAPDAIGLYGERRGAQASTQAALRSELRLNRSRLGRLNRGDYRDAYLAEQFAPINALFDQRGQDIDRRFALRGGLDRLGAFGGRIGAAGSIADPFARERSLHALDASAYQHYTSNFGRGVSTLESAQLASLSLDNVGTAALGANAASLSRNRFQQSSLRGITSVFSAANPYERARLKSGDFSILGEQGEFDFRNLLKENNLSIEDVDTRAEREELRKNLFAEQKQIEAESQRIQKDLLEEQKKLTEATTELAKNIAESENTEQRQEALKNAAETMAEMIVEAINKASAQLGKPTASTNGVAGAGTAGKRGIRH